MGREICQVCQSLEHGSRRGKMGRVQRKKLFGKEGIYGLGGWQKFRRMAGVLALCHRLEVKTSDARAMAEGIGETVQRVAAWKTQEAVASRIQQARRAEGREPAQRDARVSQRRHEEAAPDAAALMRRFSSGTEEKEGSS